MGVSRDVHNECVHRATNLRRSLLSRARAVTCKISSPKPSERIRSSFVKPRLVFEVVLLLCATATNLFSQAVPATRKWKNGLPSDEGYFPIAVWVQDPKNAPRYKAAGIN